MKILFAHQNFPGQYLHLAQRLAKNPRHQVVFLTQRQEGIFPRVDKRVYAPSRGITPNIHHYLRDHEAHVLNAQAVLRQALSLKKAGFVPDIMLGHNGWGEIWYLKEAFPNTPLIGYFEFFYLLDEPDARFSALKNVSVDTRPRLRTKNAGNLLGLHAADFGQTPTKWQHSTYPLIYQSKIKVLHEGVDSIIACPNEKALFIREESATSPPINAQAGDEILTFVARNLEPTRGFDQFMRALPQILAARPQARVLIVGGDEVSYGAKLPEGENYRLRLLAELGDALDVSRVHFLGKLPYFDYLRVLQVSRAHVYLTYPFVLSWSALEAMSCGSLMIASKTSPVEEVMTHNENALLVDFFDVNAIADSAIAALKNSAQFAQLKQNARTTIIENYDLQTHCLPAQLNWMSEICGENFRK